VPRTIENSPGRFDLDCAIGLLRRGGRKEDFGIALVSCDQLLLAVARGQRSLRIAVRRLQKGDSMPLTRRS
jgi:hypothetical protein